MEVMETTKSTKSDHLKNIFLTFRMQIKSRIYFITELCLVKMMPFFLSMAPSITKPGREDFHIFITISKITTAVQHLDSGFVPSLSTDSPLSSH
jgi:hypothetical protein